MTKQIQMEAEERATRSKEYAKLFPHLVRPDEVKYQTIEWQAEQLLRWPMPNAPVK